MSIRSPAPGVESMAKCLWVSVRMRSCCWSEHCPSLCLSFSPFPLTPQCCSLSPAPSYGFSQGSAVKQRFPWMCNEPWSVTELWSMGICCCTQQLSAPGTSARAALPKELGMHPHQLHPVLHPWTLFSSWKEWQVWGFILFQFLLFTHLLSTWCF